MGTYEATVKRELRDHLEFTCNRTIQTGGEVNFRRFESDYKLFLSQGTRKSRDLKIASFFLFVLRRLVFALAEHPERNRDEQNQYAYHEQVRYPLPHAVSLVASLIRMAILPQPKLACRRL